MIVDYGQGLVIDCWWLVMICVPWWWFNDDSWTVLAYVDWVMTIKYGQSSMLAECVQLNNHQVADVGVCESDGTLKKWRFTPFQDHRNFGSCLGQPPFMVKSWLHETVNHCIHDIPFTIWWWSTVWRLVNISKNAKKTEGFLHLQKNNMLFTFFSLSLFPHDTPGNATLVSAGRVRRRRPMVHQQFFTTSNAHSMVRWWLIQ